MTKTDKIKDLIENTIFYKGYKIITWNAILEVGLDPNKEYLQKWCDCYLITRIAREQGWKSVLTNNSIILMDNKSLNHILTS